MPSSNFVISRLEQWEKKRGFVTPIIWSNVFFIASFHFIAVFWLAFNLYRGWYPKWQTAVLAYGVSFIAGFGVTAGVHRYWCHRSYKAKLPLQILLATCFSIAGQNTIFDWVRDHRVHHKFSETSADPHDANRGLFFSHVGWLMMRKHPDVIREGSKIDMSDIANDPVVQFHTKYFTLLKLLLCFVLPPFVPRLLWNESWDYCILSQCFVRYVFALNVTWSVNSFAHFFGNKPYDRSIMPSENKIVSLLALGEGWHNYHHTFPWDYKTSELPLYSANFTTFILDFFSLIGWAYDFKVASPTLIKAVVKKRGVESDINDKHRKDSEDSVTQVTTKALSPLH